MVGDNTFEVQQQLEVACNLFEAHVWRKPCYKNSVASYSRACTYIMCGMNELSSSSDCGLQSTSDHS